MGLQPTQKISFEKFSKNTAARVIQNFGLAEGAAELPLEQSQNFDLKLAHLFEKDMLKISKRYLKRFLNNHQFTEKFWMLFA